MKKTTKIGLIVLAILAAISVVLGVIIGFLESFRIVFGSVFVLFLPGFIITFIFFNKTNEIDWLERIALSFALSIAIVPLVVFYLNLAGIKINLLNTSLIILGIIAVSLVILNFRLKKSRKPKHL